MTRFLRLSTLLACSVLVGLSASCASSTHGDALSPPRVAATHRIGQPVRAAVSGGSGLTAMGGPGITNETFRHALEKSLVESGMFSSAGDGGYQLDAFITNINQPILGFSMTVDMEVSYNLHRGSACVWKKSIKSSYQAPFGESVVGVTRLRKATEGAARENITELVRQLNVRRP